jgi:DNA-binding transcriptional LysR family regulator
MNREPWFGVELRHLAALSAVAREGSFRGAADRLGYVQSAVSQQIANLERLVGVRLVQRCRGSKGVQLTEAGDLLLVHAEEILARLQAAHADVTASADAGEGKALKVGVSQSVATGLLPDIIRRLAAVAPELNVVPVEAGGDAALLELVEYGSVDVAFRDFALEPGTFESSTICFDPCALLVQADSEWATRAESPTLADVAALPLIARDGWHFHASLESWFQAQGLSPTFVRRAENDATVRAFVAAGVGAAIVPWLAGDPQDRRLAMIDLADVLPARNVSLCWNGARAPRAAVQVFLDAAQVVSQRLSDRRCARPWPTAAVAPLEAA